jgi:hypothetical protein
MKRARRPKLRKPGRSLLLRDRTPEPGTEPIPRIPGLPGPASYDARAYRFTGASGAGLPDGGIYPAPPRTHQAAGRGWTMTVDTAVPSGPMDPRVRRARDFIELEVADLKAQGMLYRVDDAEQVRQRGEDLDERSLIALTVAKAARHLMGPREPWDPR